MSADKKEPIDFYSRVDYRRVVAWPERIQRESPFLLEILSGAPEQSLLDLGCGTGEHSRFFAHEGFRVVGVDRSEGMLEVARSTKFEARSTKFKGEPEPNLEFVLADLRELGGAVRGRFGAAISLGNTLVHLAERDELEAFFSGLSSLLLDRAIFLFQILNYQRIFDQQIRYLPLNFREEEGEQIIFLRLMELLPERRVRFCPSTLRFDGQREPHLEVVKSKVVELRGWTQEHLRPILERFGLVVESVFGDMQGGPFVPSESHDLVVACRKRG